MKVIISDYKKLEKTKIEIKKGGHQKLYILADFDRTLTYGVVNRIKTPSIMAMLRDGKHLSKDYTEKAHVLFNKYHPIEIDLSISLEERKKAMQEWWETHSQLLIESGLSKSDLEDVVKNGVVRFRNGIVQFVDFLYQHDIPLVVLSASGCGDAIQLFFQKVKRDYPNIFYITNQFNWDKNGKAISLKGKIIHSLNKDEIILQEIPEVYKIIKDRKNVVLLGDNIGDIEMIKGFDYNNLLKIGFLNFDYNRLRGDYEKNFDIVLEGDGDFNFIYDLTRDIIR